MSARQTGLEGTMMPPPPSSTGQIGSTAATGTANPLDGSALRALPPLPHPDLLGNITPATTLDLRRHLDHLSRLAEKIGQNGISESPPAPPSANSLVPLPLVPAPPTRISKPSASAAAQTLRSRIQRRPKPFGRYSGDSTENGVGETSNALDEHGLSDDVQLDRVLAAFNATQREEQMAESSAMGAARARGHMCEVKVDAGRGRTALLVGWTSAEDGRSAPGPQKRRKVAYGRLTARIRLDSVVARHTDMKSTTSGLPTILDVSVRTVQLLRPSDNTTATRTSTSESLLSDLLTSQHLGLAELLDRLPHIPSILSSPCIFCSKYIRPPDGLPLQGVGFIPEKKAKQPTKAAHTDDAHSTAQATAKGQGDDSGDGGKALAQTTIGGDGLDGKVHLDGSKGGGDKEAEAHGHDEGAAQKSGDRSGVQGRWVNWHASCDV